MSVLVGIFLTSIFCPQPREKGHMRFHKLQNVQIALDFLKHRQVGPLRNHNLLMLPVLHRLILILFLSLQVKLVNIRNDDIADGNPKLILGLIWTIILHFQVSSSVSVVFRYLYPCLPLPLQCASCCFLPPWSQSKWGTESTVKFNIIIKAGYFFPPFLWSLGLT